LSGEVEVKGFIRKTLTGWVPADDQAQAIHKREKVGQVYRADIVQPRNYRHHCMFMALLDLTFQNQSKWTDDWAFRSAVALEAGHVRQFVTLDGEMHFVPLRYSYDDIPDEQDFTVAFGKAMSVCAGILKMQDLDELEAEVSRYADEHYGRAAA
jgi:hypothetical protein